jgi:hypothetical protein
MMPVETLTKLNFQGLAVESIIKKLETLPLTREILEVGSAQVSRKTYNNNNNATAKPHHR